MSSSHEEIERKYEAPADADVHPDLSELNHLTPDEHPDDQHLEATYFDTPGRALGANRVVVRRRRGGHDEGWHVKFALGDTRHEVHYDLLKTSSAMPAAVSSLLGGITLGEELAPIAELTTQRRRTVLRDDEGREVAEVCDDTVHSTDFSTGTERQWREWEVELLDETLGEKAQNKVFKKVEKVLKRAGATSSTATAKIARALGQDPAFDESAQIEIQESPQPAQSTPALTGAQKLISAALHEYLDDVPALDLGVHAGVEDSVHQLRIRLRGLRSILRGLRGIIDADTEKRLSEGLKASGGSLSPYRDLEVVREVLSESDQWERLTQVARDEISEVLVEEEAAALRSATTRLRSEEHLAVLTELRAVAAQPVLEAHAADWSGKKVAKAMLSALNERLVRRGGKVGDQGDPVMEEALEGLHDVRKAAKSLRYVIDTLSAESAVPKKKRDEVSSERHDAKKLQSQLGRTMDLKAAVDWLDHAARVFQRRKQDRYALGVLAGATAVHLEKSLDHGLDLVNELD
ncbi:CYTH and CHAD domain-containing protein [Kocuria massiliensis]|uniref:CYTH and CHAD domain-containing protein n=1 Tax=Kocuria massiliensis TaxID=1926282 RepID=UPI001301E27D|nr:CYTH and CHAD domain-containing protein [Kocuria massiliensis]